MLRFGSLEKFSLNFWSSSFVTRVLNLFHSWPSLSLYGLIQSVWCFFLLSLLILSGFLQFNLENTDLRKVLPTFLYISCVPHREWILHLHWGVTSLQRESLRTAIKFTHLGTEMFSLLLPHARTSLGKLGVFLQVRGQYGDYLTWQKSGEQGKSVERGKCRHRLRRRVSSKETLISIKGALSRYLASFYNAEIRSCINGSSKIMMQFCYLGLYHYTETIYCRLALGMARMETDWNLKKLASFFKF